MHMNTLTIVLTIMIYSINGFNIRDVGKQGIPINQQICNVQTILNFNFSPDTIASGATSTSKATISSISSSNLEFLDSQGNMLNLSLSDYSFENTMATYATGYNNDAVITADAIFLFTDTINFVYVFVPFTTTSLAQINPDVIDLTALNRPTSALNNYNANIALSAFNFLNGNTFNLWYTMTTGGSTTVLVSNFIYKISSTSNALTSNISPAFSLNNIALIASTGDKLCYGSTSEGNFQTQFRENVALWFVWFGILLYWAVYFYSDATTASVFDANAFTKNRMTMWSMYSISQLAHEQFFTRLSRLTMVLIQWTLQGVIIASIMSVQYSTGLGIIVWSVVAAWIITLLVPMVLGHFVLRNIYSKYLIKYDIMQKIKRSKHVRQNRIDMMNQDLDYCNERIFAYFHWYYCTAFLVFWICWPITISRLQSLPRTQYAFQWYWLASMLIIFLAEYIILEPLFLFFFRSSRIIKNRGGFYYNINLGLRYKEVYGE